MVFAIEVWATTMVATDIEIEAAEVMDVAVRDTTYV